MKYATKDQVNKLLGKVTANDLETKAAMDAFLKTIQDTMKERFKKIQDKIKRIHKRLRKLEAFLPMMKQWESRNQYHPKDLLGKDDHGIQRDPDCL